MPRVELDQRSREASLRLEQIKRLLKPSVMDEAFSALTAYLCSQPRHM